ncbi:helix-turn-helix domain-containing protein [Krasilnikoviella flava]|uniref:Helix-turn-helix domain-containing protein n=1 Tax=Krasilnikoviella flava TaxID=526729 RepID=A0A1T5L6X3_9MICO|nr:helix-turn-helix domain-containing protein [Krasilnikoviella flava]SKC71168.1 Helix-turn-helix domain-containing protein [Krasilnikoviella flava]
MLTIDLSAEDLTRLRAPGRPDPMWDTVLSLHLLQNRQAALAFDPWRRQVRARFVEAGLTTTVAALAGLAPFASYFPDFLTPTPEAGSGVGGGSDGDAGIEAAADRVASTPRRRLARELAMTFPSGAPPWVRRIASGEAEAMRWLAGALRRYHDVAVAPYVPVTRAALAADQEARGAALRRGGIQGLMGSFDPLLRRDGRGWTGWYPVTRTLALHGRPLTVVPSVFCVLAPVVLEDDALDPVLVYPVDPALGWVARGGDAADHQAQVAHLIGPTRARVLEVLEVSRTTTELARVLDLTPATASRHATVLREAGLVSSERQGNRVLHTRTRLGDALLAGRVG